MKPTDSDSAELLAAGVSALINQRAAHAYLHDLRGSLHALQGALELLARVGKSGVVDPAKLEKATLLARRAIAGHEALCNTTMNRLTSGSLRDSVPPAEIVGLDKLLRDAVFFLRHEVENAGVKIEVVSTGRETAFAAVDQDRLFVLLVGLVRLMLDSSARGAELEIRISMEDTGCAEVVLDLGDEAVSDEALTLRYAASFFESNGGSLQLPPRAGGKPQLRLRCPLLARKT